MQTRQTTKSIVIKNPCFYTHMVLCNAYIISAVWRRYKSNVMQLRMAHPLKPETYLMQAQNLYVVREQHMYLEQKQYIQFIHG